MLTTDGLPAPERVPFWRDVICDVFVELDCDALGGTDFAGSILTADVGEIDISHVTSRPQHVVRSRRQLTRSGRDDFLLSVQHAGHGILTQDGRVAHLGPGDCALYDTSRPYELRFTDDFEQFVLRIPRAALRWRLAAPERHTAVRVDGSQGLGHISSRFLTDLGAQASGLSLKVPQRLAEHAISLVAATLLEVAGEDARAHSSGQAMLLQRVLNHVEQNLRDPALSPDGVAAAAGISTRYLNKLFEGEGESFSRWIWRRRLECCRLALIDPSPVRRTIGDIAFSWGFNDLSHFSRSFKERYGLSPKEYRAQHLIPSA